MRDRQVDRVRNGIGLLVRNLGLGTVFCDLIPTLEPIAVGQRVDGRGLIRTRDDDGVGVFAVYLGRNNLGLGHIGTHICAHVAVELVSLDYQVDIRSIARVHGIEIHGLLHRVPRLVQLALRLDGGELRACDGGIARTGGAGDGRPAYKFGRRVHAARGFIGSGSGDVGQGLLMVVPVIGRRRDGSAGHVVIHHPSLAIGHKEIVVGKTVVGARARIACGIGGVGAHLLGRVGHDGVEECMGILGIVGLDRRLAVPTHQTETVVYYGGETQLGVRRKHALHGEGVRVGRGLFAS